MTSNLKTPLDLELNLFENSFASKDLLHAHTGKNDEKLNSSVPEVSAKSTATTMVSPNSLLIDRNSALGTSSEVLEIRPQHSVAPMDAESTETNGNATLNPQDQQPGTGAGSNKHNLRLLNFGSVNNERLPVLTPPVFTPGGRRLPPIHLLPGLGMASPGTPGSNLWSSLLTATNGVGTGNTSEQHTGQYAQPTYPMYMRKSGTITTESNLRTGLTPGGMNHAGFNFNLPDAMGNGQMTPGLQTLLGLVNNPHVDQNGHSVPHVPAASSNNGSVPTNTAATFPNQSSSTNTETHPTIPEEKSTEKDEVAASKSDAPLKSKKRSLKNDAQKTEAKAQKTSKTTPATKVKTEARKETKEAKTEDDELDEDEKRKLFLERNRVAALKCRQRKKQQLNKMESELAFYSDGYRDLTAQVAQLRGHILMLKGILINHKDCPALLNSLGGYQQLQNIISQSEFLAHGGKNPDPTYSALPTTVPPIMNNPPPPSKPVELMVMSGLEHLNPGVHNINGLNNSNMNTNNLSVDGLNASGLNAGGLNTGGVNTGGVVNDLHVHDSHDLTHGANVPNHQHRDQIPYDTGLVMNRQFSQANGHHTGLGVQPNDKGNLRPVNSTSNLQHVKQETQISGYDLRPIASMADLQHHNPNSERKQICRGIIFPSSALDHIQDIEYISRRSKILILGMRKTPRTLPFPV
ncbi:hypothetical protein METBIDRAFT_9673 [Metschnikowia bicuspidata var. bicuspidata NRRL YB-4993]|uniref:BZIP domain-containing protein n=1 Tax=Metschnikowia bicuspidata var. bicuspidata NRRL YB-4993 TaxID=869754 RepID=A0A1A0HHC4_9ASCO|nr:hypothetical protein METBIDRAFT_9673 [Metschnikowia bicuspidata var. bicuspidata NRRL YB-4993]OBA23401.1 hypothetical protein METBIDRAFT_9673 [Metschnikowia bicuspidata var. bicuspidata NRRL YB-4993]